MVIVYATWKDNNINTCYQSGNLSRTLHFVIAPLPEADLPLSWPPANGWSRWAHCSAIAWSTDWFLALITKQSSDFKQHSIILTECNWPPLCHVLIPAWLIDQYGSHIMPMKSLIIECIDRYLFDGLGVLLSALSQLLQVIWISGGDSSPEKPMAVRIVFYHCRPNHLKQSQCIIPNHSLPLVGRNSSSEL